MLRGRRIGIDIRALTPPITGTGVVLRELLTRIAELAPDNDYFCYTTKESAAEALPEGSFHLRVGRGPTATWGTVWLQTGLVRVARSDGLDLFWGPLQVLPLRLAGEVPTVVTLHDLVFRFLPSTMSWRNRISLLPVLLPSLRRASAILTPSFATAEDAQRELGIEPRRLHVVVNAASAHFKPMPEDEARRAVSRLLGIDSAYLLFVGTLEPRKNLLGLLEALEQLDDDQFDGDVVLVGGLGWKSRSLSRRLARHRLVHRVHLTGYVPDCDLPALYSGARLFVLPSLYEGFGLPLLEAMSCGTPVVCSDRVPLPEVSGGAAQIVSLEEKGALAAAIAKVWADEDLRSDLSARGLRRAQEFSWDRGARTVVECFEGVLGS